MRNIFKSLEGLQKIEKYSAENKSSEKKYMKNIVSKKYLIRDIFYTKNVKYENILNQNNISKYN